MPSYSIRATSEDLASPVACIRLVGSASRPSELYHWRVYLVLKSESESDLEKSVIFDMTPGADAQTGFLLVTTRPQNMTSSVYSDRYDIPVASGFTASTLWEVYAANGRLKFRFSDEGTGCRTHTATIVGDLETNKFVAAGSMNGFRKWIDSMALEKPDSIPAEWDQGTYYQ